MFSRWRCKPSENKARNVRKASTLARGSGFYLDHLWWAEHVLSQVVRVTHRSQHFFNSVAQLGAVSRRLLHQSGHLRDGAEATFAEHGRVSEFLGEFLVGADQSGERYRGVEENCDRFRHLCCDQRGSRPREPNRLYLHFNDDRSS